MSGSARSLTNPVGAAHGAVTDAWQAAGSAAQWLGDTLPCVAYAPSGTGELARLVARAFAAGNHACLMRNHGVVCVGRDINEARERVAALEAACAEWFSARLDEAPAPPLASEKLLRETFSAAMFPPGQGGR